MLTLEQETPETALWEFVPLASYGVPALPARSAARNAWISFKRVFWRTDQGTEAPIKQEANLRALSQVRLQHLFRPLDWHAAAAALDQLLGDWWAADEPEPPVKFIIGQPHGGHREIVRRWGERRQAAQIATPSCEQILARDQHWFDDGPPTGERWVLPGLEHCYLRHANGLDLVRRLFQRAESGRLGRGVIGCDSWAWAYLQRVWPVPRPDALTLQAFDGPRLARLLSRLTVSPAGGRVRFRHAVTGNDILIVPAEQERFGPEIVQLAAHCRGNVGVALRHWRERLCCEPDADASKPNGREALPRTDEQTGEQAEESVWVAAELTAPVLPLGSEDDFALVLHALLLHGGLPEALLPDLLPLSPPLCAALLYRLRNAGFVEFGEGRWHVAVLAYAAVRDLLRRRDYLVDGF